ncbi:MAG: hypothetical protein L0177_13375, partial [Chloroflexi bacterium]|nr:hypothetical protein [Chloroflexota bacterium]
MRVLKSLAWVAFALAVTAAAIHLSARYELFDRFTTLFLSLQAWLPLTFHLDQFLVVLVVISALLACLTILGCMATITGVVFLRDRRVVKAVATRSEFNRVKEHHQRCYEQLLAISEGFAKQLDKRMLVQRIMETASQMTSVSQANSVVSLWQLQFETDTIRFEQGLYCDETLFARTEFQLTEQPFAHVMSAKAPRMFTLQEGEASFIKRGRLAGLNATSQVILQPLIIEQTVLGVLVLLCHPDALKRLEEQRAFYQAVWGELTLALAIGMQGAMAILDRLTGTHNREYFMKRLVQELERAKAGRLRWARRSTEPRSPSASFGIPQHASCS